MIGSSSATAMSSSELPPAVSPISQPALSFHDVIATASLPPPVVSPSLAPPPPSHTVDVPPVSPPRQYAPPASLTVPPALPPPRVEAAAALPLAPISEAAEAPPHNTVPDVNYFRSPPPPPPQSSYSHSPPEDRAFLPPRPPLAPTPPSPASPSFMLINGSSPSSPPKSSPTAISPPRTHKINSPNSSKTSTGEIIGICVGISGLFCILSVTVLLLFILKRKKKVGKVDDCESPPRTEKLYGEKTKKKMNVAGGANPSQPLEKPFLLLPCSGDSHSTTSEPNNEFSPRVTGKLFAFSIGNFTYQELEVATEGFSESNLLGEGGFGYVHKGVLPTGRQIAVKQLKIGSRQGEREFQAEVETISRVHHRHLVSLVGYCIAGVNRLLVYEFVPNKTVSFHLREKGGIMDWETRMKIAIGSARGLAYLHEDCNPTIIHRDIKTSNILLDSKFEAKVSDFGLAKFFSEADHVISHVSTRVVGTFGYLAPEYALSGKASDKSDVFSFGVVLLELITGLEPIGTYESFTSCSLVAWARPLLRRALEDGKFDGLIDPHLINNYNLQEMAKMVICAAACIRQTSWRRPRMSQIVRALEGDISLMDLDEEVRPGDSAVSGGHLNVDLRNMDKNISDQLEMRLSSEEIDLVEDDDLPSDKYWI